MKFAIITISLICFAFNANAFLFKDKYKDGCDPNPCEHKGTCKLMDPKGNKKLFECFCTSEYHGVKCEKKSGCRKNFLGKMPCGKHGTCSNDAVNPSKYHCKCEHGYVGKDCDTVDKCLKKNPCKAGSVCSLDAKLRPVCQCQPGFKGSKCDKRNCTITEFKGKYISGIKRSKVFVDEEIENKFERMDSLAKLCNVEIRVTQSFTKLVNPNDMPKNNFAPFFIGRGLRFEVMDKKGKKVTCDTKCLGKLPIPDKGARCFVDGLDAINWKYSSYLPGVVHDGYHVANFGSYNKLKELKQVGCQQVKKFPVVKGRDHLVVDYKPNSGKECPTGLAGPKCNKDDLCVKKNPCSKGSECSLDKNLKPVCACPIGFTGSKCNKKNCTIEAFKGKRFGGHWYSRTKVYVSKDLHPAFEKLDKLAKLCKVHIDLKRSFSRNNDPKYKIGKDAPFYVGYGIEIERLLDDKKKLLCNQICLAKHPNPMKQAKCFLDGLDAIGFKHNPKYPGTIYVASLLQQTERTYTKLKELKQVGCSDEKFYKKL